jgi:hypothetical protein
MVILGSSAARTSVIGIAVEERGFERGERPFAFAGAISSTKLFHAAQFGHFPIQRGEE